MKRILLLLATMLAAVLVASGMAVAASQTFSNTSPIKIVDASAAEPYPSQITVSGFSGPIRDVNLTLRGFTHSWPDDAGVLLVGPRGQTALLMSDVGYGDSVVGVRLVLDDEATDSLPDLTALVTGTYKPTQGSGGGPQGARVPADFPLPAPAGPYGTSLSVFDGTDPNGIWNLYALDDSSGDKGKIRGGWSLKIKAPSP